MAEGSIGKVDFPYRRSARKLAALNTPPAENAPYREVAVGLQLRTESFATLLKAKQLALDGRDIYRPAGSSEGGGLTPELKF